MEESILLCTVDKEKVLHPKDTSLFRALEVRVSKRVWRTFADRLLGIEVSSNLCRSLVAVLQILSDKTAMASKNSAFVAYPVHVALLSFGKLC